MRYILNEVLEIYSILACSFGCFNPDTHFRSVEKIHIFHCWYWCLNFDFALSNALSLHHKSSCFCVKKPTNKLSWPRNSGDAQTCYISKFTMHNKSFTLSSALDIKALKTNQAKLHWRRADAGLYSVNFPQKKTERNQAVNKHFKLLVLRQLLPGWRSNLGHLWNDQLHSTAIWGLVYQLWK